MVYPVWKQQQRLMFNTLSKKEVKIKLPTYLAMYETYCQVSKPRNMNVLNKQRNNSFTFTKVGSHNRQVIW